MDAPLIRRCLEYMPLFVIGLNHKTADVALRERLAVGAAELKKALHELRGAAPISELSLLSTCNRTEFHGVSEQPDNALQHIRNWCRARLGLNEQAVSDSAFYQTQDLDAIRHMIRVASGLDSMVLGEPQIFGQMKTAYAQAVEHETAEQELHRVFRHVFTVSKKVRSDTAIGANPVSVASVAVRLARRVFSELEDAHALLIGAGETIALAARHLHSEGVAQINIANRTVENGMALAEEVNGHAMALANIPDAMHTADIVITSTASQLPVIGKGMVEQALKVRKNKPIFIVDIAVPRDVEEQVADLDNVYLYSIDDLQDIVEDNRRDREAEVQRADAIIDLAIEEFAGQQAERQATGHVRAYRQSAEQLRDRELRKALAALQSGRAPEDVISNLAKGLTNKLIHSPSVQMKQASAQQDDEKLTWAEQLLGFNAYDEALHDISDKDRDE